MGEEPVEQVDKDQEEFDEFVSKMLRPPKLTELQNLLAQELAIGLFAYDPLGKLRHIFEALFLLEEEQQKAILNAVELTTAKKNYAVAVSLQNMNVFRDPWGNEKAIIPFNFGQQAAKDYLDFTNNIYFKFHESFENTPEYKPFSDEYYQILFWLNTNGQLNLSTCNTIKTVFISRVMPFALNVLRLIVTNYISPEVWETTVSTFKPQEKKG